MPTLRSLWADIRLHRFGALRRLLPTKAAPLPEIDLATGPVLSAFLVRIAAAVLPFLLLLLVTVRIGSGFSLSLFIVLVAIVIAAFALLLPSGAPALFAIGFAALFGLAQPPSLPWALSFAAIGYLAFRAGVVANQLPWSAKVSRNVVMRGVLRDFSVLAATAIAGAVSVVGQRLTGCRFTGPSVAETTQIVEVTVCHPAGHWLTILGAMALVALILGLGGTLLHWATQKSLQRDN